MTDASAENNPLYEAVKRGDRELAQKLIDLGANPDEGLSFFASGYHSLDVPVRGIVSYPYEIKNIDPPLCLATEAGNVEMVEMLLANGANPDKERLYLPKNSTPSEHTGALGIAAKDGNIAIAKMLLESGANIDQKSKWQGTLYLDGLHYYGCEPVKHSQTSWSPLELAYRHGHAGMVRLLLDRGAKITEGGVFDRQPGNDEVRKIITSSLQYQQFRRA